MRATDSNNGDPDKNRTCNPLLRRQVLYPVELRDHFDMVFILVFWAANIISLRFRFLRTLSTCECGSHEIIFSLQNPSITTMSWLSTDFILTP